ncbi:type II toxin-antitoxin system BrnA family antitoxin [Aphanizomenon sp. UHCC 0183]|uniref:type II toxin-antitoxin system BrnA family antitoxin n=1 Tax=Aphanizomenon sp. UHCC 0183 TaxID=2590028 RepID=UPI0020C3E78E|nr:BrnA antitoxin family protein [Aphanizomenon sp. UHCC 0183]
MPLASCLLPCHNDNFQHQPTYTKKRVNIDFPVWMIEALEQEAKRLGVTSDSIIKLWLAERLDKKVITN